MSYPYPWVMMLEQSSLVDGRPARTVTWTCGHAGCDFSVTWDVTDMQAGDRYECVEIAAHNDHAHGGDSAQAVVVHRVLP